NGTLQLWDVATRQVRARWRAHPTRPWSLAFAPDGQTLATGARSGDLKLWDVSKGRLQTTANLPGVSDIRNLAFAPDGRTLALVCHFPGHRSCIQLWDVAARQVRATLTGHDDFIEWLAFAP